MSSTDLQVETIESRKSRADTLLFVRRGEDEKCFEVSHKVLKGLKAFHKLLQENLSSANEVLGQAAKKFRISLQDDNPEAVKLVLLFLHGRQAHNPGSIAVLLDAAAVIRRYGLVAKMGQYLEYIRLKQHSLEVANGSSVWFNTMLDAHSQHSAVSFREASRLLVLHYSLPFDSLVDMDEVDLLPSLQDRNPTIALRAICELLAATTLELTNRFKVALEQARSELRLTIIEALNEEAAEQYDASHKKRYEYGSARSPPELIFALGGADGNTGGLSPRCIGNISVNEILVRVSEMELFLRPDGMNTDEEPHTAFSSIVIPVVDKRLSKFRGICLKCHVDQNTASIMSYDHYPEK